MARRASDGPVRSPANIVVGALLKRLREQRGRHIDQIALALDVSPTYLAAIESGTNALPAKSVVGLKSLGLHFVAASSLVALVSYLDCRKRNSRIYDVPEIQLRAEQLISEKSINAFRRFLEWTVAALKANETRNAVIDVSHGGEILEASLEQLSRSAFADSTPDKTGAVARSRLSPMIEDLLDIASSGLSLVTPHISRYKFKAWEELNADRMFEIRAYVDDAERLLEDAPGFDWHAILLNTHRPRLTIIIPGETLLTEEEVAERFYERLPLSKRSQSQSESLKRQIRFIKASSPASKDDIERALVFDYSQGQLVQASIWASLGKALIDQRRFSKFNNAWLYELRPRSEGRPGLQKLIGILGAYNDKELSSFGVFLDHQDCLTWWRFTDKIINIKNGE